MTGRGVPAGATRPKKGRAAALVSRARSSVGTYREAAATCAHVIDRQRLILPDLQLRDDIGVADQRDRGRARSIALTASPPPRNGTRTLSISRSLLSVSM